MSASPSFPSCEYKNPLIVLDPDGQSDVFEYNLKPGRCFDAKGYIHLAIESSRFVPSTLNPPEINFWTLVQNAPDSEIIQKLNDDLINGSLNPLIINNSYAFRLPLTKIKEANGIDLRVKTVSAKEKIEISGINLDEILNQVNKGKRPLLNRNFFGKPVFQFLEKPLTPKPQITLVFHYKICSYLGNSGAGKVVKTFSLLPGEKTVLSIRNFTSNTETSVLSQNVFDSFSEEWYISLCIKTGINNDVFIKKASIAYGESTAYKSPMIDELKYEIYAIASVNSRNSIAYGENNDQAKLFRATDAEKRNNTKMQYAIGAVINMLIGGLDYSNGATMWDGQEQSLYNEDEKRGWVGNFELHMNTMGWSIKDEHYIKWKDNIGGKFKAPQQRISPDNYEKIKANGGKISYKNKGKIRLNSTAVYGRTIFWKVI